MDFSGQISTELRASKLKSIDRLESAGLAESSGRHNSTVLKFFFEAA